MYIKFSVNLWICDQSCFILHSESIFNVSYLLSFAYINYRFQEMRNIQIQLRLRRLIAFSCNSYFVSQEVSLCGHIHV